MINQILCGFKNIEKLLQAAGELLCNGMSGFGKNI